MLQSVTLDTLATVENFDEAAYLAANPDVAAAVKAQHYTSGYAHFLQHGHKEMRRMRNSKHLADSIRKLRRLKMEKLRPFLREDMSGIENKKEAKINYLSDELRTETKITHTENVSGHGYDNEVIKLIEAHPDGLLLDCGAGRRPIYYSNVVNFEIVDYDTTDVVGVGEYLPFQDNVFDAIFSIAVLEHVRDPFRCAQEIQRVLKPGGKLICAMPFLQPAHGYPHHYFNATAQGLQRLFEDGLVIDEISVPFVGHPWWALEWIVRRWAESLPSTARAQFLDLKIADLIADPNGGFAKPFVTALPAAQEFELACGTLLKASKPARPNDQ